MLDENVQQSLPLLHPLLGLLSSDGDVPYPQVTRALSALLAPLSFETLKSMGLYPVMQQGLHSQIPEIQLLALEQAQKMTEADDTMVSSLLDCLGAEDPGVGNKAVNVITTVPPLSLTTISLLVILPRLFSRTILKTRSNPTDIHSNPSVSRFNSFTSQTQYTAFPKHITFTQLHSH